MLKQKMRNKIMQYNSKIKLFTILLALIAFLFGNELNEIRKLAEQGNELTQLQLGKMYY